VNAGLVVVGGGPAGFAAASSYREAGGAGPVRMLTADDHPPYNRPPLTKDYLRGGSGLDALPLEGRSFYLDREIDVALQTRVVSLDVQRHMVTSASAQLSTMTSASCDRERAGGSGRTRR
jgi:3-phenylpropionate/trans-cinnamate dioxygenase ferredoxin reductase subunit